MKTAIYAGSISHHRYIPKSHSFSYPFFMWFLCLDEIDETPGIGRLFSVKKWAISRYRRKDYLGPQSLSHAEAIKKRMFELTGKEVVGKVYGLLNVSSLGLYFSPVNFYYGYDTSGRFTHFLAEVSNIPWNERHQYAHYVGEGNLQPSNPKAFKVSPFNPIEQSYTWVIAAPGNKIAVKLGVSDDRGEVFNANLDLSYSEFSMTGVWRFFIRRPVMTVFIVAGIYWQALKIFIKGIPYIPYEKEMT